MNVFKAAVPSDPSPSLSLAIADGAVDNDAMTSDAHRVNLNKPFRPSKRFRSSKALRSRFNPQKSSSENVACAPVSHYSHKRCGSGNSVGSSASSPSSFSHVPTPWPDTQPRASNRGERSVRWADMSTCTTHRQPTGACDFCAVDDYDEDVAQSPQTTLELSAYRDLVHAEQAGDKLAINSAQRHILASGGGILHGKRAHRTEWPARRHVVDEREVPIGSCLAEIKGLLMGMAKRDEQSEGIGETHLQTKPTSELAIDGRASETGGVRESTCCNDAESVPDACAVAC
jgi:hypothetical protein